MAAPDALPSSEIDLSDTALSTAKILEASFREAVTEMALLTPERLFLRANAAMCRLLGRTEAQLRGMAVEDVTHPDDRRSVLGALDDARSGVLRGFRIWARAFAPRGAGFSMLVAPPMFGGGRGGGRCFFWQGLDLGTPPAGPFGP